MTAKTRTCLDHAWEYAPAAPHSSSSPRTCGRDRLDDLIHRHLYPMFQPVMQSTTGRIEYYEMLARIRGDASLMKHRKLIEVCERVGLIHRIDFFMLECALSLLAERPDLSLACNASLFTVEMESEGYFERLARHAAVANRLVIEITETRPVRFLSSVRQFAHRVHALGSRIALDDVGAGFFTLQDIVDIRADFVKLDGGLVAHAYACDQGHAQSCGWPLDIEAIKAAAVACSSWLIAEGIESAELLNYARSRGIPLVQGYFVGRPAPALAARFAERRAA